MNWIISILSVALSAAPWLLLGLLLAGLIKAYMPESMIQRWIGGRGVGSISRAAIIGMPLPICSCGAIPTALALYRGGAGRGPSTAFLIGTPGVGIDSILLTSILLGPLMAVARVAGAIFTAITTGLLVATTDRSEQANKEVSVDTRSTETACASRCCGSKTETSHSVAPIQELPIQEISHKTRLKQGLKYAFADILDDISRWVVVGLLLAGLLITLLPPDVLSGLSGAFWPLVLMAIVGIPLYICATAATPIAAGLLLAGMSPGMALVFLLAGPITSLATLGIFRREFGSRALVMYLIGILCSSVLLGWLLNVGLQTFGINPTIQANQALELLPEWLEWLALFVLSLLMLQPLRKRLLGY
ncbi:MAG TPA: SO_0444 family Cu/Zn efflux transporter [Marinospirillum sp.]|uniref:SO_0444 family Cu/Zn efflux transporter n=1 Tax=Marinospirillum sp. TaxID=2183934 RepID=UPI002B469D8F|nr:SO_0444 family Cu/Zn efflux transporter [Marinospirillum sp.]HKM14373.1 SO_0444 family Cu/Zn efflux transporter [Marinospirillum sp.]